MAGVIDLNRRSLGIRNPYVTVAGQTAPSPGIAIIKGGIGIQTHDVILQHLRVRPGEAGAARKSGWEVDAIATGGGAHDVLIDHCSASWATDENLSASGERFRGDSVEQWREGTSHRVTISHCIIAEGLDNSTHGKGRHSKGSLIHDNATEIAIIANLYASNRQRNPYFKGGARGVVANNVIDNRILRAGEASQVVSKMIHRVVLDTNVLVAAAYAPASASRAISNTPTASERDMLQHDGDAELSRLVAPRAKDFDMPLDGLLVGEELRRLVEVRL